MFSVGAIVAFPRCRYSRAMRCLALAALCLTACVRPAAEATLGGLGSSIALDDGAKLSGLQRIVENDAQGGDEPEGNGGEAAGENP